MASVVLVFVATQLSHDRLGPHGCPGIVQSDVVTVDAQELPLEVSMGKVVIGAVVVRVRVGKACDEVVTLLIVVGSTASISVRAMRVSNNLFLGLSNATT